jgi:hypothetical protein
MKMDAPLDIGEAADSPDQGHRSAAVPHFFPADCLME